ncbi:MAG: hypothetical protein ACREFR_11910, partial [Limisphaerales bacterium]
MAVSSALFYVAAGERAAAQLSPPANATPSAIDLGNSVLWHPGELLELYTWQRPSTNVVTPPAPSAEPAVPADTNTVLVLPTVPADTNTTLVLPGFPFQQPAARKNEVRASADVMYGTGTITVPIGYALRGAGPSGASFPVDANSANRSTVYSGGTLSYSYGRSWYLDFSAQDGLSTGSTSISIPNLGNGSFPASFEVNDTWYQLYMRYNFQNFLAGTRFRAYLRGGASLVKATLDTVNANLASAGYGPGDFYTEHD